MRQDLAVPALMARAVLALAFLAALGGAATAQGRWEKIGVDTKGGVWYLDVTTVVRPDPDTVVFWYKRQPVSGEAELFRIKMGRDRTFQFIEDPRYEIMQVRPDSMIEAFYRRFFR